jgi:hypothetical protein
MKSLIRWLRSHTFLAYLVALALMALPPVAMVYAARGGNTAMVLALLSLVVLGNLLVLFIR